MKQNERAITIGFHTDQLSERGTEIALFDYAYFNEKLYGNKSIIFYKKNNKFSHPNAIDRFRKTFECYAYSNFEEIEKYILEFNIEYLYNIKNDRPSKNQKVKNCINLNHAVFELEPHGEKYAAISEHLCEAFNINVPVVPHMINIPKHDENMRKELDIPDNAIVFGRHGGFSEFSIIEACYAIVEILNRRDDIYFIFVNTHVFFQHPRIIYLDAIIDLHKKSKFINTCDAMIHARIDGETFGLAIGEFSTLNKPVITTFGHYNAHIKLLGDKAIIYKSTEELLSIFMNIEKIIASRSDWNAFKEYTPEKVMKQFMNVFIESDTSSPSFINQKIVQNEAISKKIVVLTIFNENDHYEEMKRANEKYLAFLENSSEIMNSVTVFYIMYKNLNGLEYLIDGNMLYIHGEETILPGLLTKTLVAMDIVTNKLNLQYDFIIRTSASTALNYHEIVYYMEDLNITSKYSYIGYFNFLNYYHKEFGIIDNTYFGTRYCGGSFMIFNKALALNMIKNKEKFVTSIIDDVSIGQYINTLENVTEIDVKDRMHVGSNFDINKSFLGYCNNQYKLDRNIDVNNFKEQINNLCTTYQNQYSIVIPINPNTLLDQCSTYFKLLDKFLHHQDVYKIYIVTSEDLIEKLKPCTNNLAIYKKIKFVNEIQISNINKFENVGNKHWYYQQILKLKISNMIKTKSYLILDIDMFLIKPLKFDDMILNGKIIYSHEFFPHNNPPGYTNRSWWENSCKVLNCNVEKFHSMNNLMGVTPQLLITSIVNELITFLENKFEMSLETIIANYSFTEFSLYWIYVVQRGLDVLYTTQGVPLLDVDESCSVLHLSNNETIVKTVSNCLNTKKHHFLLVQGWLKIDFAIYSHFLDEFLNRPSPLEIKTNITVVSAFFNINRERFINYSRTGEDYIKSFLNYLNVDYNMIAFIDERYIDVVLKHYENSPFKNKKFIPINDEWLNKNIYAWQQLEKDKGIISSDYYKNLFKERIAGGFPENIYSEFNVINHCKIDFINYAITNNYVEGDFICWSDFGYHRSVLQNDPNMFPTNILDIQKFNKEKINCMLNEDVLPEDNDYIGVTMSGKVALTGSFYGGPVSLMKEFQELYHFCLQELYNNNISDDDQHMLLRCFLKRPDMFQLFKTELGWPKALTTFQITK